MYCTGVSVICKQHDLQKLIVYNIVLVKVVLSISPEGFLEDLLSYITSSAMYHSVFCPGLKKGTVLLEEKGHVCSRNYILRALSCAKLHFEGTFARKIIL